jgi:DNA mismatch endonuclease Vsr
MVVARWPEEDEYINGPEKLVDSETAQKSPLIDVRGCFWHRHSCEDGVRTPETNAGYWAPKIARNISRDREKSSNISCAASVGMSETGLKNKLLFHTPGKAA